jgi:DNA-binding NarL/FixJ family response regulator
MELTENGVRRYRVLVVEHDEDAAARLVQTLQEIASNEFIADVVGWLNSATHTVALSPRRYDAAILDLHLPNGQGIDVAVQFMLKAPLVPAVIMAEVRDVQVAEQCVMHGAHGYFVKDRIDADALEIALITAIRRQEQDVFSKLLFLRQTAETIDEMPSSPALVRAHVAELNAAVRELTQYLASDAPAHAPAARAILERRRLGTLLMDINKVLELDGERFEEPTPVEGAHRDRKVSDTALRLVQDVVARRTEPPISGAPTTPTPPVEATANLLDVIERRKKIATPAR